MATPNSPVSWKDDYEPLGMTFISVVVQDADGEAVDEDTVLDQWPDTDLGDMYKIENPRPVPDTGTAVVSGLFPDSPGYHRGNIILRPGMVIYRRAYLSSHPEGDLELNEALLEEALGL